MDPNIDYSLCRNQMEFGEQVLWVGQPKQGNFFTAVPLSSFLISLAWTAGCLLMYKLVNETMAREKALLLLWLVFTGVGIYSLTIWPFQAYYQQKNTVYVITDKKIYLQRWQKVKTLSVFEMNGYEPVYHKNGTGTIIFPIVTTLSRANNYSYDSQFKLENLTDMDGALQAIAQMENN